MASTQAAATPSGFFIKSFHLVCKILGLLVMSALVSVLIEWIGMSFFYPEQGYHHAYRMMRQEAHYLTEAVTREPQLPGQRALISALVASLQEWLSVARTSQLLVDAMTQQASRAPLMRQIMSHWLTAYFHYVMAAVFILILLVIRLLILVLSLPTFILFGLVGVVEGLMQRDLRRWCGGNESGFVYHWAKRWVQPVLFGCWMIYLMLPFSVHPNLVIIPFALLFGITLSVMTSRFKKYL